jgi:UDPglucose 6-dehydrogenase
MTPRHAHRVSAVERVGVIGYGYVGRSTIHALEGMVDVAWHDPAHVGSRLLSELVRWADALYVCVPTPMSGTGAADLGIVREVVARLAELKPAAPVVLKSTVPPGTTEELSGRWPHLSLAFVPEFLRERHHLEDAAAPTHIVMGWSRSLDVSMRGAIRDLYTRRFPDTPRIELDATAAELLKYAANALFGVKVSFANEMAELAARLGVDWEPVRQALVLDPRIGDGHLEVPGPDGHPGFGGSCLPKDMAGLLAFASSLGIDLDVVAATVRANDRRRPA